MKSFFRIAILLTAMLLLCAVLGSCSGSVTDSRGFVYELDKETNTYTLVGYSGSSASLTIPDKYDGLPVSEIGVGALSGNTAITSVKIPSSVKQIGSTAFFGCSALTTVEFEDGSAIEEIGTAVFSGCTQLNDITLPDSVKVIGYKAFDGCSGMTTITLPKGLSEVRYFAFANCSTLTNVTIGGSFTVYANAFLNCRDLTTLATPEDGDSDAKYKYNHETGLLTDESETVLVKFLKPGQATYMIPAGITAIKDGAFYEQFDLTEITVDSANTAYIAENGILYTADKKVLVAYPAGKVLDGENAVMTVADGVEKLANYAFCGTQNISEIKLPDSVTAIGNCAFKGCSKLRTVIAGSGEITVGAGAFSGCKLLESYRLTDRDKELVLKIKNRIIFSEDGKKLYAYPAELENTSYTIPAEVTEIAAGAFSLNKYIASFAVDAANTAFCAEDGVLYSADKTVLHAYPTAKTATEYKSPSTVEKVAGYAFCGNTSLKAVTLAKKTEALTEHLFEGCTSLEKLTILAVELDIRQNALEGCNALTVINFGGNVASWKSASDNASTGNSVIDAITPTYGYTEAEK